MMTRGGNSRWIKRSSGHGRIMAAVRFAGRDVGDLNLVFDRLGSVPPFEVNGGNKKIQAGAGSDDNFVATK
jgi:hypothetical protein